MLQMCVVEELFEIVVYIFEVFEAFIFGGFYAVFFRLSVVSDPKK
jgi:hypothetical protein